MDEDVAAVLTDEQVALQVQKGHADSFGILVERYEDKLMRYGRKFLSNPDDLEDSIQSIFIRAYEHIQSFDVSQRFSPWIYRIAHNTFVNQLRAKSRSLFVSVDFDTFLAHPAYDDPAERARDLEEVKQMAELGLSLLSPKFREILTLYYFEDMSYKDIADILQIPQGTVGVRLARAKKALAAVYVDLHISYES